MDIRKSVMRGTGAVVTAILLLSTPLHAQSLATGEGRYQNQLTRLSEILGQLHHLRGTCARGEQQLWRDNMMELIRLENPPSTRKNEMVAEFNASFEKARKRYPNCGPDGVREAIDLAREGAGLSEVLSSNISR